MNIFRSLAKNENEVLHKLLNHDFPGSDVLRQQLVSCLAKDAEDDDNYGSIYLKTSLKERAEVVGQVPIEATMEDNDSAPILILLHVIDGYLGELEVLKLDGTPMQTKLSSEGMKVTINKS